ncbi:BTB/POZ and MATH domain-containing protein 2-like [Aegilops tauschii subsp. strangulata]|uniref:Protein roadkill n=1 Tax=Aegilops tauschii TaxID=37682 RepID=M8AUE6_AEGTA
MPQMWWFFAIHSAPTWGNGRFVRIDALERSADLKSDCFTIRCDVVVCNTKDDDAGGTEALPSDIHQDFSALLQNKVGADVTFEVGDETFAAHRCVLAARSTVFMAQLFGPMKEGTASSSVIHIKDMEAKVFKALLSFVHSDSFPEMYEEIMEENAMSEAAEEQGQEVEEVEDETGLQWLLDLLVAADRYDLQGLKFICGKQLSQRIGVSSVASVLALAEQHHCHGLKAACLKFIQAQSPSRLQTVMATDGWELGIIGYKEILMPLFEATKTASVLPLPMPDQYPKVDSTPSTIRNEEGTLIAGRAGCLERVTDAPHSEALAMLHAANAASRMGRQRVIVETDSIMQKQSCHL